VLREDEAKSILKEHEIPVPDFFVLEKGGVSPLQEIRYPTVAKVCSDRILHKTDVGGVILDIGNGDDLSVAIEKLKKKFPGDDILIEPMEEGNMEIIVGVVEDSVFGRSIMFGLGGVRAELYGDVTFRTIPVDEYDVEEMFTDIKGSKILEGFRGTSVSRESIKDLLLKVSRLGEEMGIRLEQLDLNPVLVNESGLVVVDAKMVLRT